MPKYTEVVTGFETESISLPAPFSGTTGDFGALSNAVGLLMLCPDKFKLFSNPWNILAFQVLTLGADMKDWDFKSPGREVAVKQLSLLRAVRRTPALSADGRVALAGWMLSEMLTEVPVYVFPD